MAVPDQRCCACGRRVIETGDRYVVEAAWDRDGLDQAGSFLLGLESGSSRDRDRLSDTVLRVEAFARTGSLIVPRELNFLSGELWEIKAGVVRLPFYYRKPAERSCSGIRLTHGFIKRGEKTPRKQIDLGLAII